MFSFSRSAIAMIVENFSNLISLIRLLATSFTASSMENEEGDRQIRSVHQETLTRGQEV